MHGMPVGLGKLGFQQLPPEGGSSSAWLWLLLLAVAVMASRKKSRG